MAYEQLPMVEEDVDKLRLDLDNYRIPTHHDDEAAALKFLFAFEDVIGAARMILRDGYFDNEVPIVTSEQGGLVVLEGNRRVSALKALIDPTIVPSHESELRGLLKRYAVEAENLPTRIRLLLAPDRTVAAPHIARLHTSIPKRRWSRDQQATFYYSLLDESTTVEDIRGRYPETDVPRFIKMAVVRRFISEVPFTDHSLRSYAASDGLRMSSFEYAYRMKDIAAAVGLVFDGEGQLLPRTKNPAQVGASLPKGNVAALEYLLGEFRAGRLNTRSLEFKKSSVPDHDRLIQALEREAARANGEPTAPEPPTDAPEAPDSPAPGPGRPSDPTPPTGGPGTAPPKPTPRGPNHPDTKDTLDLSGVGYGETHVNVNLKTRYIELRKISLSETPASAAIVLRSVLEAMIKWHFEGTATSVSGELKAVFQQVATTYGGVKALRNSINTVSSGNGHKPGSITWFNLVAHSADISVTPSDVRQAWALVNPVIRQLLRPPVPGPAPQTP